MMYIIDIILITIMSIGIWILFLPKKSRRFRRISIVSLVLAAIIGMITNHHSFTKDPFLRRTGVLKPKDSKSSKIAREPNAVYIITGALTQEFNIPMDEVVYPLGEHIPLAIKRTKEGLYISAIIYNLDTKVVAEIHNNNWELNPNNYFKKNFDKSGLEVIDNFYIPILQVDYISPNCIRIGGVFRSEHKKIAELYPRFPRSQMIYEPIGIAPAHTVEIGDNYIGLDPLYETITKDEQLLLIEHAKSKVKSWFDYANPDKFGIRYEK